MTSYLGGEVKNTLKYKVTKDRGAINRGQPTFFFLNLKTLGGRNIMKCNL